MPDGMLLQLAPLAAGWAKLAELRRHMEAFAAGGKWTVAWMSQVCGDLGSRLHASEMGRATPLIGVYQRSSGAG
jgi:hypothetical protein